MYDEKTAPTSDDWPPYDHGIDVSDTPLHPRHEDLANMTQEQIDELNLPEGFSDPDGIDTLEQGENRVFSTGAQRDTAEGKLRMSLLPQAALKRVMKRYLDGAEKYGENNWMKGMPMSAYYDCAHRHLEAWWSGETGEDHAAAVVWNMLCAMWSESTEHLDDKDKFPNK